MKKQIRGLFHSAVVLCGVMYGGLVGAADVGFVSPYEDWRTPMQLSVTTTKDTFYEPVSVCTTQDMLCVSFGWTANGAIITPPQIKFAIVDVENRKLVEWVEPATSFRHVSCAPEFPNHTWYGGYVCEVLKFLDPGDYQLEAEIDPFNTLGETLIERKNNTAIFRFAVRDESLTFEDVFTGNSWQDITAIKGNDFAQAPFVSRRGIRSEETAIQFGPYVPMDGKAVSSRKKPLDLVFVIDATGSMSDCIYGLLQNISVFIDQLFKGDPNQGIEPIDDLRIKLVSFGDDYGDRNTSYGWYQESEFSSDLSYLKSVLGNGRFFGGYNGCYNGAESSFDALWYVVNEWVPDTPRGCYQKTYVKTPNPFRQIGEAARAVILFSDEPAWADGTKGFYKYPEMTAIGCRGKSTAELAAAVTNACIDLTIVTDNVLRGWDWGFKQYNDLIKAVGKDESSYIHNVSKLSQFTQSFDNLRELANSISASVPTVVVEPTLKVSTSEMGTLSFMWKNDSVAGTNNLFTFAYTDGGVGSAISVCESSNDWAFISREFNTDGLHTFEWTYRKLGYEGAIADCGLISEVKWTPCATQLKIDPESAEYKFEATNNIIKVICNQDWEATVVEGESWVHLENLWEGNGNGEFIYTVDENATYSERFAKILVTAGKNNGVIVTREHTIRQEATPYQENGEIELLDVGIKPRWPWNSLVDIDFRVIAPAKGIDTPVTVDIKGIDCQAEGFGFRRGTEYVTDCVTNIPTKAMVDESFCRNVTVTYINNRDAIFTCPSSGVYRITLDLGQWQSSMWRDVYKFHTPKFRVLFNATARYMGKDKKLSYLAEPVRIDTRVGKYNTGGYDGGNKLIARGEYSGGVVITGTEKIGHPEGRLDPFDLDTTKEDDGRHDLTSLFEKEYQIGLMTNLPIVVLNKVKVEGGVITNNTTWSADVVHLVRDNVFVMEGAKLVIEDGAVVKFLDNSYVFLHYDTTSGSGGYETLNLEVKGAYIYNAYNPTVGGDTLYAPSTTNWMVGTFIGNETAMLVFHDHEFKGSAQSKLTSSDLYSNKGIRSVWMYVPNSEGKYSGSPRWVRSYTRMQKVGDTLPRPAGANEGFVGWYTKDPNNWSISYLESYYKVTPTYMVLTKSKTEDGLLYALSADSENETYNKYMTKVEARPVEITLEYSKTPYNGKSQKPAVKLVKVGETEINAKNYEVEYSNENSKEVGVYTVTIKFKYDYTNEPSTTYAIVQKSADGGAVTLTPPSRKYNGNKLEKPKLTVTIDSRELTEGKDYEVGWSAGDWLSVGAYRATVELKGNYYGTLHSEVFKIEDDPNLAVVFFDTDKKAEERQKEMAKTRSEPPRILYITGVTNGSNRAATCGIIDLLKNDSSLRPFVLTNFVCRYDDYGTVGSNRCASAYSSTFAGKALPFIGIVSENDINKCLIATNGYLSASDLLAFLTKGLTVKEEELPELINPTEQEVREQIAQIQWADKTIVSNITTAAAYTKFREWVVQMNSQTPSVDLKTIVNSSRAYLSSRVSSILESPVLLGEKDDVKLEVTEFSVDTMATSGCEVVVELKVGNPPSAVQLKAAKEAFADIVWLGENLQTFNKAGESDITEAELEGKKVKLTIQMPSELSGFLKLDL